MRPAFGFLLLALLLSTEWAAADSLPAPFEPRPHHFAFAGLQWDQRDTPNCARLLGEGTNLGGLAFSAGLPTGSTAGWFRFPSPGNFRDDLTLGCLTGLNGKHAAAVMLPNGNDGDATRHGVEVGWSDQRTLANRAGLDFAVYEAGRLDRPEGFLVRVREAGTQNWTRWFYRAAQAFELYARAYSDGAFVFAYDLSELGVPESGRIDAIQLANVTASDRVDDHDGGYSGFLVHPSDVAAPACTPRPPRDSGQERYAPDQLDPDPLYVAALHPVDP